MLTHESEAGRERKNGGYLILLVHTIIQPIVIDSA